MKCPNCGNEVQEDAIFCDQCGTRLRQAAPQPAEQPQQPAAPAQPAAPPQQPAAQAQPPAPQPSTPPQEAPAPQVSQGALQGVVCPNCGHRNTPGEMFCDECGTPLAAPQPEPAAVAQAQSQPAPSLAVTPAGGALNCPDCGATVGPDDEFCYACGANLKAAAAQAAAAPAEGAAPEQPAPAAPQPQAEAPAAAPAPQPGAPAEAPVTPETTAPPQPQQAPTLEQQAPPTPTPSALTPSAATTTGEPTTAGTPLTECPACGAAVSPGDTFCEFCGAALVGATGGAQPAEMAATTTAQGIEQRAPQGAPPAPGVPKGGRLVIETTGAEFPLVAGGSKEVLVGREDPYTGVFPDIDLTSQGAEDNGVSRRHFKITQSGGQYMIEDLNSTNFTLVNRQRLQPGQPVALKDGDEIRAGRLRMTFRMNS